MDDEANQVAREYAAAVKAHATARFRLGVAKLVAQHLCAFLCGVLAYFIAVAAGVEPWRDWVPGDAADIGATFGFIVYLLLFIFANEVKE